MDEYLDEEVEFVKQSFEMTCRGWEKQVRILVPAWNHLSLAACSSRSAR